MITYIKYSICLILLSIIYFRSVHIFANDRISLFFMSSTIALHIYVYIYIYAVYNIWYIRYGYIYMCVYIYTYIHSYVDGHLGCFHILVIVNNAACLNNH